VRSWGWAGPDDVGTERHSESLRTDHFYPSRVLRASWTRSRRFTPGEQGSSRLCISHGSTSLYCGTKELQCTSEWGLSGR
jgi:hypothetical protein